MITPVPDFGQDERKPILTKVKHNLNHKLLQMAGFPYEKKRPDSISRTNTLDFLLSVLDYNTYMPGKGQQMKLPSTARVCLEMSTS